MTKEEIFYETLIQSFVTNATNNPDMKNGYNMYLSLTRAKYVADMCSELVDAKLNIKDFNYNEI